MREPRGPQRNHEAWRFADLKKLAFDDIVDAAEVGEAEGADLITRSVALEENAGRIIFANDRLIADPLLDAEFAQKGVIFKPLSQALVEDTDLVRLSFMQQPARLGSEKFAALHRARLRDGIFPVYSQGRFVITTGGGVPLALRRECSDLSAQPYCVGSGINCGDCGIHCFRWPAARFSAVVSPTWWPGRIQASLTCAPRT